MTQLRTLNELQSSLKKLQSLEEQLSTIRQYLMSPPDDLVSITFTYRNEYDALRLPLSVLRPGVVSVEQSLIAAIKEHCEFLGVSWGKS